MNIQNVVSLKCVKLETPTLTNWWLSDGERIVIFHCL